MSPDTWGDPAAWWSIPLAAWLWFLRWPLVVIGGLAIVNLWRHRPAPPREPK